MKKIFSIIFVITVVFMMLFTIKTSAASLTNISVTTDKQTIKPGENVVVTIEFGQSLGSYTFDVAYDKNIFEYVSATGGTANDTGTKVIVYYFDQTGGNSPRTDMSVTFKAKSSLTTSNPTNFLVTAEGLANADASVTYDDITTPIKKDVTVKPETEVTPPAEDDEDTNAGEQAPSTPAPDTNTGNGTGTGTGTGTTKPSTDKNQSTTDKTPTKLPQTGYNTIAISGTVIAVLAIAYIKLNKKK